MFETLKKKFHIILACCLQLPSLGCVEGRLPANIVVAKNAECAKMLGELDEHKLATVIAIAGEHKFRDLFLTKGNDLHELWKEAARLVDLAKNSEKILSMAGSTELEKLEVYFASLSKLVGESGGKNITEITGELDRLAKKVKEFEDMVASGLPVLTAKEVTDLRTLLSGNRFPGDIHIGGNLRVDGDIHGARALNIAGLGTFNGGLNVAAGATGFTVANALPTTLGGALSVTGASSFSDSITLGNDKHFIMGGSGEIRNPAGVRFGTDNNLLLQGNGGISNIGGTIKFLDNVRLVDDKNFQMGGTGIFTSGTGEVQLNGNVKIAANMDLEMVAAGTGRFTSGGGAIALNGGVTIAGGKNLKLETGTGRLEFGGKSFDEANFERIADLAGLAKVGNGDKVIKVDNAGNGFEVGQAALTQDQHTKLTTLSGLLNGANNNKDKIIQTNAAATHFELGHTRLTQDEHETLKHFANLPANDANGKGRIVLTGWNYGAGSPAKKFEVYNQADFERKLGSLYKLGNMHEDVATALGELVAEPDGGAVGSPKSKNLINLLKIEEETSEWLSGTLKGTFDYTPLGRLRAFLGESVSKGGWGMGVMTTAFNHNYYDQIGNLGVILKNGTDDQALKLDIGGATKKFKAA